MKMLPPSSLLYIVSILLKSRVLYFDRLFTATYDLAVAVLSGIIW